MKSSFYVYCVAFWCTSKSPRLATLILLWVIKLLIYLSLETQRALVFGRGVCERQIPKVGIRRSFGYVVMIHLSEVLHVSKFVD